MLKYIMLILILIVVFISIYKYVLSRGKPVSDDDLYYQYLKEIKKAFNNILIDITEIPKIGNRTLVRLNNIDDLVDISEGVRKPIYYIENDKTCDFMLLNNEEYCLYTLKLNEDMMSKFDLYYAKNNEQDSAKILEDLNKTTIIKLPGGSSFKVSPLRDRDLRKMKEREEQIRSIENIDSKGVKEL